MQQRVAALEHHHEPAAAQLARERHGAVGERAEAADGDRHAAERVGGRGVLAGADEQQLGPERPQHGRDHLVERVQVAVVAGPGGERDVDVRPLAGGRPADLEQPAVRRVEAVLVQRDGEHRRVVEEDRLGPVAVVHVPVEDRDALDAAVALRPAGGDRGVVEQAEAHRGLALAMVPRRAQQGERVVDLLLQHGLGRREQAAGGEQHGVAGPRPGPGVHAELDGVRERGGRSTRSTCASECASASSSGVANVAASALTWASTPLPSNTLRVSESRSGRSNASIVAHGGSSERDAPRRVHVAEAALVVDEARAALRHAQPASPVRERPPPPWVLAERRRISAAPPRPSSVTPSIIVAAALRSG